MEILEVAAQGGVLLLEGPTGAGKTSLALECAHRLPQAHWISCWPRRERLERPLHAPIFLDHIECLENVEEWLALCAQQVHQGGLVAISDRRLELPGEARIQRLLLDTRARADRLPQECQILSLPIPRSLTLNWDWIAELDQRFFLKEEGDWISLHPDLQAAPSPEQRQQALALLQQVEPGPLWAEVVLTHLYELGQRDRAFDHFRQHFSGLHQQGEFKRLLRMAQTLLAHNPRQALIHFARSEARAGLGQLESALADLDNVLRWGEPELRLRALASRCHLRLDLGQPQAAAQDARAALELCEQLGGRQPARIKACNGLARVHNLQGQPQEGENWARQALELARNDQDPKGEAYSFFILGQSLAEQERWQESLSHCQSGLVLAQEQREVRLTLLARYWMAAALLQLQRPAWAEEILQESYAEARAFGDLKMLSLGELMMAQLRLAQHEKALAHGHLKAAEELVQRCGYPLLAVRGLLLKQVLLEQPEWGERAQLLAEQVGLALSGARTLEVWSNGQCRRVSEAAVAALRSNRQTFELWIDLEQNFACRGQRGEISLLGKKIPTRLLLTLMRRPGQAHSAESLFAAGWEHAFEGDGSAAQVRKNIATLRNLLGPEAILVREHAFGQSGGYFFNDSLSYCVIHRGNSEQPVE